MASIRGVVKLTGVSLSTVFRVMNGTAKVDDEKRQKVERAISETGFKPNEVARSLYKCSSKVIDILMPNIIGPFFNGPTGAVEEECDRRGYRLTLCNSNDDLEKEKRNLSLLERMNADGVILMTNMDEVHKEVGNCRIPVVMIGRQIEGGKEIACIQSNYYQDGRMSMEHPLERDCRHIVQMSGPPHLSSARKHHRGYLDVYGERGIEPACIEGNYSLESGTEMAERSLERYPGTDGIIATNDMVAISVYKELHRKGIRVPEDIQLIRLDNISLSNLFTPEITTITQPVKEMGQDAIRMLTKYVTGAQINRNKVFDVELIKGDTALQGMSTAQYQDVPRHQRDKIKCKVEKEEL